MNHAQHEPVCQSRHTGHTCRMGTNKGPQVRVTLSNDLLNHLRHTAQVRHVPLQWLVAGLVCDTLETGIEKVMTPQPN